MATETTQRNRPRFGILGAGAVGGLVGGVGMGLILHFGTNAMPLIGALYGLPTVLGGWVAHLIHSVIFALVFAAIVTRPLVSDYRTTNAGIVGLGIGYGAALGLVTGGFILPLSLNAIGATTLPAPLLPIPGIVGEFVFPLLLAIGHLVYGFLLGGTFAVLTHTVPAKTTADTESEANN